MTFKNDANISSLLFDNNGAIAKPNVKVVFSMWGGYAFILIYWIYKSTIVRVFVSIEELKEF